MGKDESIPVTRNSTYKGPEAGRSMAHFGGPEKSHGSWNTVNKNVGTRIR